MQAFMKTETEGVRVCGVEDLIPGSGVAVLVQGEQVALFYCPQETDQTVFAVGNYDPIGQANVISRGIVGDKGGTLVVASPLYKQHFCLRSGVCLEDAAASLPVYPVSLDDGHVVLYK